MDKKRLLSSILSCSMALSLATPALAAGNGTSDVTLKVETGEEPSVVQVKVPSEIPISQDKDGVVTVADNLAIQNLSTDKAVDITAIRVTGKSGWEIIDYGTDISGEAEGTKKLGLEFRGDGTTSSGAVNLSDGNWSIAAEQSLDLNVNAKLPKQGADYETKQSIAQVDYTIDVHEGQVTPPPVEEGAITNNWDSSTKMLPTGSKPVTFSWDSTDADATITSVESSNPGVATIAKSPASGFAEMPYNGTENWVVTAVGRGTTTITATLSSGETTTFEVGVYELTSGGSDSGDIEVTVPGDGYNEGDDLGDSDITIEIPVTGPDGGSTVIEVTPDIPDGTELQPGDNNIEVDVDVNGVTLHITITINVASSNPSDGLTQTVEEAQAMGFTFSSYEDGLQIDSFENKQFKSEINVPEQIGDFKVLKIGDNVFKGQSNLKVITLPNTVKEFGTSVFDGCTGLSNFAIPNGVTVISDSLFNGCTNLITVGIPDSVTSIGSNAFKGCTNLPNINIPESVTKIGNQAFYECSSLLYVTLSSTLVDIGDNAFSYAGSEESKVVVNCNIPSKEESSGVFYNSRFKYTSFGDSCIEIGDYSFYGNTNLESVVFSEFIENIGIGAFENCTGIADLTIPSSVTSIGKRAFKSAGRSGSTVKFGCDVPKPNVVYTDESVFSSCGFSNIEILDSVTKISAYVFSYSGFETITISDSVKSIDDLAFTYCSKLVSIKLSNSLTSIPDFLFDNCVSLKNLSIPSGVTTIGESALRKCSSLESVDMSDGITVIKESAFDNCRKLSIFDMPDSVKEIGSGAFSWCTSLNSLTIPDSVSKIDVNAFYKVPHIYYNGTASGSPWGALAIN